MSGAGGVVIPRLPVTEAPEAATTIFLRTLRTGGLLAEPRFAGVRVEVEAPMAKRHNTMTLRSESKN